MITGATEEYIIPIIDPITGQIDLPFSPLPLNEDYFFVTRKDEIEKAKLMKNFGPSAHDVRMVFKIPVGELKPEEAESFLKKMKRILNIGKNE